MMKKYLLNFKLEIRERVTAKKNHTTTNDSKRNGRTGIWKMQVITRKIKNRATNKSRSSKKKRLMRNNIG